MHASDDIASSPRSGLERLIVPWEYRHLPAVATMRFTSGGFTLGVGLVLLSLGRSAGTARERRKCNGWAAFFLGLAALSFSGGLMDTMAARSAPPRT